MDDFDPSSVNAGEKIKKTLREMAPNEEIYFERVAVTPEQIREWDLPTRPTKTSDTRAKSFGDISVELDAIEPEQLRELVREVIEQHLPGDQFAVLKAAEASERKQSPAWWITWCGNDLTTRLRAGGNYRPATALPETITVHRITSSVVGNQSRAEHPPRRCLRLSPFVSVIGTCAREDHSIPGGGRRKNTA
jgi:hypothetical protein